MSSPYTKRSSRSLLLCRSLNHELQLLEICGLNCKMPHPIQALERNACLIQFLILALYIYIVCSFITYASPHPFTFFLTYLLPYLHFPYYWHMVGLLQCACIDMPLVLWRCWLGFRKGIRPVKNWVVGRWHGYLSGARCRLAYGPADATALNGSCISKIPLVLPFWYRLTWVVPEEGR